jgi:hypothetical protein
LCKLKNFKYRVRFSPTLLLFALGGMDILDQLPAIADGRRADMIEWLYTMQVEPQVDQGGAVDENLFTTFWPLCKLLTYTDGEWMNVGGFRGTLLTSSYTADQPIPHGNAFDSAVLPVRIVVHTATTKRGESTHTSVIRISSLLVFPLWLLVRTGRPELV